MLVIRCDSGFKFILFSRLTIHHSQVTLLYIRDQLLYPFGVRLLDQLWPPENSLSTGRLLRQNMTRECLLGLDPSRPGLLKPFCCSSVGLQFWHVFLLF